MYGGLKGPAPAWARGTCLRQDPGQLDLIRCFHESMWSSHPSVMHKQTPDAKATAPQRGSSGPET